MNCAVPRATHLREGLMGETAESRPAIEEPHHGRTAAESPSLLLFPGGLVPSYTEEKERELW